MTFVGSLVEIAGGMAIFYLLRKQKGGVALGVGGPLILLGLTLLAIEYGLISGIVVWVITGIALILLGGFSFITLKRT